MKLSTLVVTVVSWSLFSSFTPQSQVFSYRKWSGKRKKESEKDKRHEMKDFVEGAGEFVIAPEGTLYRRAIQIVPLRSSGAPSLPIEMLKV